MPFNKIQIRKPEDVDRVQEETARAIREIELILVGNKQLIEVDLDTGTTAVAHGRGQPVSMMFVVYKNAQADIWVPSEHAQPRQYVNLTASAVVTVRLVFL